PRPAITRSACSVDWKVSSGQMTFGSRAVVRIRTATAPSISARSGVAGGQVRASPCGFRCASTLHLQPGEGSPIAKLCKVGLLKALGRPPAVDLVHGRVRSRGLECALGALGRRMTMKRFLSAGAAALLLLSAGSALAQPYGPGPGYGHGGDYGHG